MRRGGQPLAVSNAGPAQLRGAAARRAVKLLCAICLGAAFLCGPGARAADESVWRPLADRVFKPVAQNADLPNALIPFTMTEGEFGFLWLGGDGGLMRWDGYEFHRYLAQPNLPDGLRDAESHVMHRDAEGTLWVGTTSAGLARYDPVKDRMICVKLTAEGCGSQHVWSIDDDGARGLWVGTNIGLIHLDPAGNLAGQWHHVPGQTKSLPDEDVLSVLHDRHGVLWIGTSRWRK